MNVVKFAKKKETSDEKYRVNLKWNGNDISAADDSDDNAINM